MKYAAWTRSHRSRVANPQLLFKCSPSPLLSSSVGIALLSARRIMGTTAAQLLITQSVCLSALTFSLTHRPSFCSAAVRSRSAFLTIRFIEIRRLDVAKKRARAVLAVQYSIAAIQLSMMSSSVRVCHS